MRYFPLPLFRWIYLLTIKPVRIGTNDLPLDIIAPEVLFPLENNSKPQAKCRVRQISQIRGLYHENPRPNCPLAFVAREEDNTGDQMVENTGKGKLLWSSSMTGML